MWSINVNLRLLKVVYLVVDVVVVALLVVTGHIILGGGPSEATKFNSLHPTQQNISQPSSGAVKATYYGRINSGIFWEYPASCA